MAPKLRRGNQSGGTSKKGSPGASIHDIYYPQQTNFVSNPNIDNQSEHSSFNLDDHPIDNRLQNKSQTIEKVLNRLGLEKQIQTKQNDQQLQMLVGNIVQNCVGTIDTQSNLDHYQKMYQNQYKEMLKSKSKKSSIIVSELTEIEKIQMMGDQGIIAIAKEIRLFIKKISIFSCSIVQHSLFQSLILLIIILNSIYMALDNPLTSQDNNATIQTIFIVLYTLQMIIKIFAFGFLFNQNAYLRDLWNILDFVIVLSSLLPYVITIGFSVNSLRAIRVLRPLKTITKVKSLKMIVSTLFYSFSLVMDSLYILFFVMIVFSIAGSQLFSGVLKNRCIELATGNVSDQMCSGSSCSQGFACGRGISNPNFGIQNFDTFLWSMLSVFQTLTMEGWSQIMIDLEKCYSPFSVLYSLLIVFFCEYVLLNMTMAILKYKYSQVKGNTIEEDEVQQTEYQPEFLKKIGVFKDITTLPIQSPLERYYSNDKIFVGAIQFNRSMSNSLDKCLESNFQAPPATRKSLGRIKTLNISKNAKFDLSKLSRKGKIDQIKWDAKTLQFQSIQLNAGQPLRESMKILKQVQQKEQKQQNNTNQIAEQSNESSSMNSLQIQSSSDESDKLDEKHKFIDQKIYQMQMKLGQSRKNINDNPLVYTKSNKAIQAPPLPESKIVKTRDHVIKRPEIRQMDEVLGLVKQTFLLAQGALNFQRIPNKINENNIVIPQINFNDYKVDRLYERFGDLGEYRVKRIEKINELNFFAIKQVKKHSKTGKKQEVNILKQITEQTSLDIKQLQLVNELIKKKMKCRIKAKQFLDEQAQYDKTRVLVYKASKQQERKAEQLELNLKNLAFHVTYKTQYDENHEQISTSKQGFTRNYDSQYKGLRITEFTRKKQRQDKGKSGSSKSIVSKTANYMKLLQSHNMEQKIQFEEDKIMSIFFKKQKQVKVIEPLNKLEQQFKKIKEADIFNRHGHIKMVCPISMNQESEQQFLESINIKDEQYEIYIKGILGMLTVLRKKTLLFINKPFYDNLMLLFVLANTITLALNGSVDTSSDIFIKLNMTFTFTFAIDLGLKIFSYGFDFFSDIMNLFDTFVVTISIVEMAVGTGGSNLSALRSVRILRAFRVLRVTRLIRSLSYMKIVMSVVSSVITEFVYIFMLLALFIFIYTLLGMQIFGGQFLPQEITGVRQNFDTFFNAVFTVFQILTVQNWNDIEIAALNSSTSYFSIVYIVSWIFIGNWILLNLLQAILLDGFDKDSSPDTPQEEEQQGGIAQNLEADETQSKSTDQESYKDNYKKQDASLLLFYPSSPIRIIAVKVTSSKLFQNVIIFCICLSSIKLVIDTYISSGSQLQKIAEIIDYVFNGIFILECVLKVIARGFIFGENSYIKDNWSKLDFLIVSTAIIDMVFSDIDLSILKLFRTLRPLRIVSRNLEMKIIISSLAQSMCGILNVMIIIVCVFIMFGILGINLLQGKLNFCNSAQFEVGGYGPYNTDQATCLAQGGAWTTHFINFDNIVNSLLSMYVFSTRQNWPFYVYTFIDSSENGPSKDSNQLLYMLFSVVIIFVCSYFFMDLLVGVLFMNFHEAQLKLKPKQLTDKQINWKNLQKIIIEQDPCFQLYLQPQNPIKKFFHKIVTCKAFEYGIIFCILGNIAVMISAQDDESNFKSKVLTNINFAFSIIFMGEMVLKLSAFGRSYFLSGWNIFDFFVVMASILDIILNQTGSSNAQSSALSILPQIARIFRVLRVTRLLRMFKRFKGLQKLIETFIFSFPALARGLSIVSLFLFISSVLASYLFSSIQSDYSGTFNDYRNFQNFHMSIQSLFVATTGQNWYFYMYETTLQGYVVCKQGSNCVQFGYLFFWLVYIFFSQKVFMELFVLIVLDQFESNYIKQNNPLGIFALFEDDFRTNWIQITTKYNSQKIETKRLIDLLLVLKQPLGLGKQQLMSKYEAELKQNDKLTQQQVNTRLKELDLKLKKNAAKQIQKMDIIKNRLYLGYHETFYRFAKLALMTDFMEKATENQKHLLDQIHKQSEQKLVELMPKGNNYDYEEGQQLVNSDPLNPIQLILFSQMIIKSWHNYSLKFHSQKKSSQNKADPNYSLNNSCASDVDEAQLQKLPVERKLEKRKGMLETNKNRQMAYQFRAMPNIDDHYQHEKKRLKKGPSSNSKGLRGFSSINALQRLTSSQDRKTQHQQ